MSCPCYDPTLSFLKEYEMTTLYCRKSDMAVSIAFFEGCVRNHKIEVPNEFVDLLLRSSSFSRVPFEKDARIKTVYAPSESVSAPAESSTLTPIVEG